MRGAQPQKLSLYPWRHRVEVVGGDVLDERAIKDALVGCDAAVYLVHSMSAGKDFSRLDRRAALTFRSAAADAGIRRIVYLGASAPRASPDPVICAVATRLATSAGGSTPVTEVRAAAIVGSGSLSLRDVAFPHRSSPGDDHTEMGAHSLSADCGE